MQGGLTYFMNWENHIFTEWEIADFVKWEKLRNDCDWGKRNDKIEIDITISEPVCGGNIMLGFGAVTPNTNNPRQYQVKYCHLIGWEAQISTIKRANFEYFLLQSSIYAGAHQQAVLVFHLLL